MDNFLNQNVELMKRVLGTNIVGIYLHGSLAMGGFNPKKSDIDYLVIVKEKISAEQRKALADGFVALSANAPAKGIEMHVVLLSELQNFKYPTPFEFHYSQLWHDRFARNEVDLAKGGEDPDLAAHFTVTKARGICLFGEPIDKIFPTIPSDYYKRAIFSDVENAESDIIGNPVYYILNLCRVLVYLKKGIITSKIEGGEQVLDLIDEKFHYLIEDALKAYQSDKEVGEWNSTDLRGFAKYMLSKIGNSVYASNL